MNLREAISVLYEGSTIAINEILLKSIHIENIQDLPNSLVHTGFVLSGDNIDSIELMYDLENKRLLHQLAKELCYPRRLGMRMWLLEKRLYSPFFSENYDCKIFEVYFYKLLHEDKYFNSEKILYYDLRNFATKSNCSRIIDPEHDLDYSAIWFDESPINEKVCKEFIFSYDLGNDLIEFSFPTSKYYRYFSHSLYLNRDVLYPFLGFAERERINLNYKDHPQRLGQEELDSWNTDFPGWHWGIWD